MLTSDSAKAGRIAYGVGLIKKLQQDFAPIIPNDNLPFFAAALITNGGPYNNIDLDLSELITLIDNAGQAVRDVLVAVQYYQELDANVSLTNVNAPV